ncbi:putative quinol monooxygenase [Bauldia sp.]|uniref:putative quinol monooxygenase n=1 Tax=Bauldia sp. TaxID=2575872 RepID=UPI003BAB93F6
MFAVCVSFEIDPAQVHAFRPLMQAQARNSLDREPECLRFDICTDPARPTEVFLYELYVDAAAFATHLETEHFRSFNAAIAAMVVSKDIRTFTVVET